MKICKIVCCAMVLGVGALMALPVWADGSSDCALLKKGQLVLQFSTRDQALEKAKDCGLFVEPVKKTMAEGDMYIVASPAFGQLRFGSSSSDQQEKKCDSSGTGCFCTCSENPCHVLICDVDDKSNCSCTDGPTGSCYNGSSGNYCGSN